MEMLSNTSVLRHTGNGLLYRHIASDRYRNIITGIEGEVPPEKAKEIFRINVGATGILNKYPMVEEMIKRLGLKIDA